MARRRQLDNLAPDALAGNLNNLVRAGPFFNDNFKVADRGVLLRLDRL